MRLGRLHLPFLFSSDEARALYEGGRANPTAVAYTRLWAMVFTRLPGRWVTLEVPGRTTGRQRRFPLGEARIDDERYLVSMLGENCNWVRNVRASGGIVKLRHGRTEHVRLVEIPAQERALVLKRYVEQVPGARPHIPVDRHSDASAFELIASRYPVFKITRKPRETR